MSYVTTDSGVSNPSYRQAWRDDYGVHATVYLSDENSSTLFFSSAADARAMAAACTEAAEALDKLAAEPAAAQATETRHG